MKSGIITIMKFLLGWPLSFVALIFIVRIISPTIGDLGSYLLQINIFFLFLSFLCFLSYYSLRSFFWYKLLRYKNHRLSFRETAYFWSISEIKRFIPGNIWSLLGKTHAFSQHNITKKTIFSFFIIEAEFLILGSMMISLFAIPFLFSSHIISFPYQPLLVGSI